ncbi:type II toxin-antitoxin system VapC family toxin [Chromatium okenii]|uniref:DNA-binding protein n=1 Tax=Chromatium okenii TaxID=61644 RepID=A0A2S7XMQ5_9GAMM|nr:type II toxin-antitoxin system VapC family toxin [Chromatium okenii]MBV5310497.1 type II toxin-antitoxin system VapC family toxin [Chromatium okenii]PQJ95010.1 DNA-binding protein [Chromatium okenii]
MRKRILVDSNVLLDIITHDPHWSEWSTQQLSDGLRHHGRLVINPIVFAEISFAFETIEAVNDILSPMDYDYTSIPREAAFLAARCHAQYRIAGGLRTMILPDFLIGAHAVVDNMTLLTRDVRRYRTYFPSLQLICPGE